MIRSMLLVGITMAAANVTVAHGEPPQSVAIEDEHPTSLDGLVQQFDAIGRRLSALKAEDRGIGVVGDYWIDRVGVLRLPSGRPMGFWGIDGPPIMPKKR